MIFGIMGPAEGAVSRVTIDLKRVIIRHHMGTTT